MAIGQAYSHVLTDPEQQAIQHSCDILIDSVFDNFETVEKPVDVDETLLGTYLPQRYLPRYTPLFFKKFAVCIITVAWKLAQSEHMPLSSLAEELATRAIIQEAKGRLEDRKNAFDTFIDRYFEDTDVAFLFDDRYDGLAETEVAKML